MRTHPTTARGTARRLLLLLATLATAVPAHAAAQQATTPDSTRNARPRAEAVDPASPRASLDAYLRLARAGDYATAAGYLDLPDSLAARGPALARDPGDVG